MLILVFLVGAAVGLAGSYLPREWFVRRMERLSRGCPCGRPPAVLLMTITRAGSHPIRYVFLRCDYHAAYLEEILMHGADVAAKDTEAAAATTKEG